MSRPEPTLRSLPATSERRFRAQEIRQDATNEAFLHADVILNLEDLKLKVFVADLPSGISKVDHGENISFLGITLKDNKIPHLDFSLTIYPNLRFNMVVNGAMITTEQVKVFCGEEEQINSVTGLANILAFLKSQKDSPTSWENQISWWLKELEKLIETSDNEKVQNQLCFLLDQMRLSLVSPRGRRYNKDLLSLAVQWYKQAPALYRELRYSRLLCLPHPKYLNILSSPMTVESGLNDVTIRYLAERIKRLNPKERHVNLMIDEIHTSKSVEFSSGKIFGIASGSISKTMLCVMITSVGGHYDDVVVLQEIDKLSAKKQVVIFWQSVKALTEIGFEVCCGTLDNATANRSMLMNELNMAKENSTCIVNPFKPGSKIFLCFDSTHNWKNLRNNWESRRTFFLPPFKGEIVGMAEYGHLEEMYDLETRMSVKMAHRLNHRALHPSNLEKTNALLTYSIHHESTSAALKFYAKKNSQKHRYFSQTAAYIDLIIKKWNICNVKTTYLHKKKRDPTREPITSSESWQISFLRDFASWVEEWHKLYPNNSLTTPTTIAVVHTCKTLADFAEYLLNERGFEEVLLGRVQSDKVERRFGMYRLMPGSNFFVSARQIYESEKIIRVQALMKYSNLSLSEVRGVFMDVTEDRKEQIHVDAAILLDLLNYQGFEWISQEDSSKNIIYYVSGYIARSLKTNLPCLGCKSLCVQSDEAPLLSFDVGDTEDGLLRKEEFLLQVSRGGLSTPSQLVFLSCFFIEKMFDKIRNNDEALECLLASGLPREVFVECATEALSEITGGNEILDNVCSICGVFYKGIFKRCAFKFFNCCMKNYVGERNSGIHKASKRIKTAKGESSKNALERKVAKLSSNKSK